MKLSSQRKDPKRSWPEHFLYLVAVGDARGGADELVLDNIVNFASAKLALVLKEKYDPNRVEHNRPAEDLAHFAQSIEPTATSVCREVVAAHVDTPVQRKESRSCYECMVLAVTDIKPRSRGKRDGRKQ
ncbi:unnamed protein product [Hyaloperonospora brassicae]|uniref:PPM-type phosphatase domain-containing protein n=1 Tax=Hyaloperonospora brassicae TaxID=162125 RepID=A0AAV0TZ77_HYABA|nr:unnamed protein product [Hyaloperonospora brassicae]